MTGSDVQFGIEQEARNLTLEHLIQISPEGRPEPLLAESWAESKDGLVWTVRLRQSVTFHDGTKLTAPAIQSVLETALPPYLGTAYSDIKAIRAMSNDEIQILMNQRSTFVLDGLEIFVTAPGSKNAGTGPFRIVGRQGGEIDLSANQGYYLGAPEIDRIELKPYPSVRSAWAEMLRGQVDVLFDVSPDAYESLQRSSEIRLFTTERPYAYLLLLNIANPVLSGTRTRRLLNAAIDRQAIVAQAFKGHAIEAETPVPPRHWAIDPKGPKFEFAPQRIVNGRTHIGCLLLDSSYERLALEVQRQLDAVGIALDFQTLTADEVFKRVQTGNFDTILADIIQGPTLLRAYQFWHTGAPFNYGHFSSQAVDAALDTIRHAADDDEYRRGVAAFQRAMVDDPPAIFLAWGERARAVSRRFDVPVEPGRDILSSLRLWRPAQPPTAADRVASRH